MVTSTDRSLPIWLTNLLSGIFLVLFTWYVTTGKMDAVQENRLSTVEKSLESKASKESVEGIEKRLERIDGKLDRLLERK
jgi:hypothetical protein